MKLKNIFLTGFCILISYAAFSQAQNSNYDLYSRTIDINQKSLAFGLTEAQFEAIKDEAYVNPLFVPGKIFQGDQLIRDNVLMRFNAYADEIEIKKNSTATNFSALVKDPDIFVKIANDVYVLVPFRGSNANGGYFNVLSDGKTYDLYKKTTAVYREPRKARTTYDSDIPPSFDKTTTYYLVKDGTFLEMPNRKSKLLNMMSQKKDEIKDYIKQNKLDLDKEKDLIDVISYFDSLL